MDFLWPPMVENVVFCWNTKLVQKLSEGIQLSTNLAAARQKAKDEHYGRFYFYLWCFFVFLFFFRAYIIFISYNYLFWEYIFTGMKWNKKYSEQKYGNFCIFFKKLFLNCLRIWLKETFSIGFICLFVFLYPGVLNSLTNDGQNLKKNSN